MRRQLLQESFTDCRYFANGICSKGNACTFRHDVATRNENICQFNMAGKCSFGQACRFKHTRPQNTEQPRSSARPSSSSSTTVPSTSAVPPRVRPVQLTQPGLNVQAVEFVPRWKTNQAAAAPMSYAAAAAPSPSYDFYDDVSGVGPSSSAASDQFARAQLILCPYHEKNGDCNRDQYGCRFAHGDKCDMCNQWSLHPFNEELRKRHMDECVNEHTREMERAFLLQKTEQKTCGICMENIFEKNLRFGILNGCQHCFCLECIRTWRQRDQTSMDLNTKTVRSCPECRQHSDYVIPSLFWVEGGQEKEVLIEMYKENTKSKVCKYYKPRNSKSGNCPFGNKCFYKHQLPDGTIDPGESPHLRRRARLNDYLFPEEEDLDLIYQDHARMTSAERAEFQSMLDGDHPESELFRSITEVIRSLQSGMFLRNRRATVPAEDTVDVDGDDEDEGDEEDEDTVPRETLADTVDHVDRVDRGTDTDD